MAEDESVPPLLIAGGGSELGHALADLCELRGIPYRAVTDIRTISKQLAVSRPWAVVAAGAEPRSLAATCVRRKLPLLTFSGKRGRERQPLGLTVQLDPEMDLADALNLALDLLIDGERGIWQLSSAGPRPLSAPAHSDAA